MLLKERLDAPEARLLEADFQRCRCDAAVMKWE